jgi:hypothetical protein
VILVCQGTRRARAAAASPAGSDMNVHSLLKQRQHPYAHVVPGRPLAAARARPPTRHRYATASRLHRILRDHAGAPTLNARCWPPPGEPDTLSPVAGKTAGAGRLGSGPGSDPVAAVGPPVGRLGAGEQGRDRGRRGLRAREHPCAPGPTVVVGFGERPGRVRLRRRRRFRLGARSRAASEHADRVGVVAPGHAHPTPRSVTPSAASSHVSGLVSRNRGSRRRAGRAARGGPGPGPPVCAAMEG